MEFNEKLQELRKQKGFTQQELAKALFVSRTAVSKWESGRGYPNIDSLKQMSKLFSVTIDELLSGDQLLDLAQQENNRKQRRLCDLSFGLLDVFAAMLLFLPLFAQRDDNVIRAVSLLDLASVSPYLKTLYFIFLGFIVAHGVLTLALQNCNKPFWVSIKNKVSVAFNIIAVVLLILSSQPYAAIFLFAFLVIKTLLIIKK